MMVPPSPSDKDHSVRIMFGNGLRASIWSDFVTRFSIKDIAEFYGATEGNSNLINIFNKPGAIGFASLIFPEFLHRILYPLYVIKIDPDTLDPVRNQKGFCQEVGFSNKRNKT